MPRPQTVAKSAPSAETKADPAATSKNTNTNTAAPHPQRQTLRHPLVVALAGLVLGALAQAVFIGGQMSQRVKGVEAGLERIHARLDWLYSRDMADRDLAKIQLQFSVLESRVKRLEDRENMAFAVPSSFAQPIAFPDDAPQPLADGKTGDLRP